LGQEPGVVIRSTTSLVQVRLVAENASGKAVTDLKQEDFQIQDNRKAQPLSLFVLDRGVDTEAPGADGVSAAGTIEPAGYALIVLDWLNTKYSDRLQARDMLVRMLRKYQPRQKVGLYLVGRESYLIHDFTSDGEELLQAAQMASLDPADLGDDTPGRFDARAGSPANRRPSVEEQLFFMNNRVTDTLLTLRDIATRLARVPGRKSLVWLSAGFPIVVGPGAIPGSRPAEVVFWEQVDQLLERLNRSDVAVYAVDARGLAVDSRGYPATLQEFAERTGGTAFVDRNDLDEGMRLALEDMRVSYILGFHVPENAAPGLHEIRVTVNRPGVRLRYRASYQLQ
jgi:VWFA-related protein